MKTLDFKKWLVLIGIIMAAVIVTIPQAAMAGGGGGPAPGSLCGFTDGKFAPPPFIGEIQVSFQEDSSDDYPATTIFIETFLNAPLVRYGQNACQIELNQSIGTFDGVDDLDAFNNLKSVDMQGACFMYIGDEVCFLLYYEFLELLSIGNMRFFYDDLGRRCFSAKVIAMPLTGY